jgi:hypothetical protein
VPEAITFPTREAFNARIDQAARARLRELGIEDPKAVATELEALRQAEKDRKAADMSEREKLEAAAAAEKARADTAEAALKTSRSRAELATLAASKGIRNVEYLRFKLDAEGDVEDRAVFIDKLLEKEMERVALGIPAPPPPADPEKPKTPATTTPSDGNAPQAPPAGKAPPEVQDAFQLSDDDWARRKAELGIMS